VNNTVVYIQHDVTIRHLRYTA